MGFAGALKELGLPRSEFVTALVTFNFGVEAGQLAVICAAFLLVGWYCGNRPWYRRLVVVPASAMIACTSRVLDARAAAVISARLQPGPGADSERCRQNVREGW